MTVVQVLLLGGAIAGLIGERLVNRGCRSASSAPVIAGLVGAWLMVDLLHLVIAPELALEGIPVISAILGAAIVVFLTSLVSGSRFGFRGFRRY